MKRIVLLACGMLLMVASTAEARRSRNGGNYSLPVRVVPAMFGAAVKFTVPEVPSGELFVVAVRA